LEVGRWCIPSAIALGGSTIVLLPVENHLFRYCGILGEVLLVTEAGGQVNCTKSSKLGKQALLKIRRKLITPSQRPKLEDGFLINLFENTLSK